MEQRNHISRRLALQTRRVSATELTHSPSTREDGGGEWATEAAHGCLSASFSRVTEFWPSRGGSGVHEKGPCKRTRVLP